MLNEMAEFVCSIGSHLNMICHQSWLTKQKTVKNKEQFSEDKLFTLSQRVRLSIDQLSTVCAHHENEMLLSSAYFDQKANRKCCDPFNKHKKK